MTHGTYPTQKDGRVTLPDAPGLGSESELRRVQTEVPIQSDSRTSAGPGTDLLVQVSISAFDLLQRCQQIAGLPQNSKPRFLRIELRIIKRNPLFVLVKARVLHLTQGRASFVHLREHHGKL